MFEKKSVNQKVAYTVRMPANMMPVINKTVKKLKALYPDEKINRSTFTETAIRQFIKSWDEVE